MNGDRLVIAPARPFGGKGDKYVFFETRRDVSGEIVGIAFTNVGRLAQAMGENQPWVCLSLRILEDFYRAAGVNRLVLNAKFQGSAEGDK